MVTSRSRVEALLTRAKSEREDAEYKIELADHLEQWGSEEQATKYRVQAVKCISLASTLEHKARILMLKGVI